MSCPIKDAPIAPRTIALLSAFGAAILFTTTRAYAFNSHQPFDISADVIDYLDASQEMTAEGHVIIVQTSTTLTADFMRYDRGQNRMQARGHVIMRELGKIMMGDFLDYDVASQKGTLYQGGGYVAPWRMQAKSWEKQEDYYLGREASFTSCDLIDPHYHIRSSRVHFIPDKMFWAWNSRGYIDRIPVFYTPFLYKYLDKQRIVFQVAPGNDTVKGAFAKTTTTIRFVDRVYDRVFFDHYSVAGNGFGNEFDYNIPGKIQGSLFGYYINPHANADLTGAPEAPQYTTRFYHWQKLSSDTTLQSNSNLRKNVAFNNQFFSQDTNESVNDITSSIALTQQKKQYNQRVVFERLDAPDPGDTTTFATTHVQSASLPRYDFTLYQIPLWNPSAKSAGPLTSSTSSASSLALPSSRKIGPILFNMTGSAGNNYSRIDDQIRTNASTALSFSDSILLSRRWSFTPSVSPQLNWQDKFNPLPPPPAGSSTTVIPIGTYRGYQGRLGTTDTLRYRPLSSLSIDQAYLLTARMEPNGTTLDRELADGGIETHRVNWLVFYRPTRQILLRSFSGYDLRRIADEDPNVYRQRRVDPWTTELTLQPYRKPYEFFCRYALGYYPTETSLSEATVRYHGKYRTIIETSLLYNRGQEGTWTVNQRLGIYLSPGWRLDTTVHALVPETSLRAAMQGSSFIDTEFIVTRDMHCWQAQFVYRSRPPFGTEYSLLFDLKFGAAAAKDIADKDLETQFYPWRAYEYAR